MAALAPFTEFAANHLFRQGGRTASGTLQALSWAGLIMLGLSCTTGFLPKAVQLLLRQG